MTGGWRVTEGQKSMRRRIYVDTSVFGGFFDEEFRKPSRQLFERFRAGEYILVVSELTLR